MPLESRNNQQHALPRRITRYVLRITSYEDAEAVALTVAGLTYSNALAWWSHRRGVVPESAFRRANLFVLAGMLAYTARRRGGVRAVGLHGHKLSRSLVGGAIVGIGLSVPPLILFYRPVLLDTPLEYGPISQMTRKEMLADITLRVPLNIALFEELLFRGLLYSGLREQHSARFSLAATSAAFAGWHFWVTYTSATESNLSSVARLPRPLKPFVLPIAVLGGMVSTGLAGLAFGLVRERTGNLAGAILAHWLVDSIMVVALWRRR